MKQRQIESLLPEVFQRTITPQSPLAALTAAMERLHAPAEAVLDDIASVYSPRSAPDRFVDFLSRWVDTARLFDTEGPQGLRSVRETGRPGIALGRLRELTAVAAQCTRIRGTRGCLLTMLRTSTGCQDFRILENVDSAGRERLFHIVVSAPEALRISHLLLERIIAAEKPASTTAELVFHSPN